MSKDIISDKEFRQYLADHGSATAEQMAEHFKCSTATIYSKAKKLYKRHSILIDKLPVADARGFISKRKHSYRLPAPSTNALDLTGFEEPTFPFLSNGGNTVRVPETKLTVEGTHTPETGSSTITFQTRSEDLSTEELIERLRAKPASEIEAYGVVLPPKPDWAATLWREANETYVAWGDKAAIEKIRSLVTDMFGDALEGVQQ